MKKEVLRVLKIIALVLLIIGGLNWGLYGLYSLDFVAMIFGSGIVAQAIYMLVGVAALWMIVYYLFIKKHKK